MMADIRPNVQVTPLTVNWVISLLKNKYFQNGLQIKSSYMCVEDIYLKLKRQ